MRGVRLGEVGPGKGNDEGTDQLHFDLTLNLVKGRLPDRSCSNIIDILTKPLALGSLEEFPAMFGFLLIKLSEAVVQPYQDQMSKEQSDSGIRESELAVEDVLSFLDQRELIPDRIESLEENLVRTSSESLPAQAELELVARGIQEESEFGFAGSRSDSGGISAKN